MKASCVEQPEGLVAIFRQSYLKAFALQDVAQQFAHGDFIVSD